MWMPALKTISSRGFEAFLWMVIFLIPLLSLGLQITLSKTELGYKKKIVLFGITLIQREYHANYIEFRLHHSHREVDSPFKPLGGQF